MRILFRDLDHKYYLEGTDKTLTSVSHFFETFKHKFSPNIAIEYAAKGKEFLIPDLAKKWEISLDEANQKWGHLEFTPKDIQTIWAEKAKISTDRGTAFHLKMEGKALLEGGVKGSQKVDDGTVAAIDVSNLEPGVYLELIIPYLPAWLIGTADYVEILPDKQYVLRDFKTDKELKFKGIPFYNKQKGIKVVEKLKPPISHIDSCNGQIYNLKMSCYCYFLEAYGYKFKEGWIDHVENIGTEKEKIVPYPMTFLKKEVEAMLKFYKK
jgi:hypothetical protein